MRVHRLATEIIGGLQSVGVVLAAVDAVDDVARWRRAARQAGRRLGWRVSTRVTSEWVWAVSDDYEPRPGADREAAVLFAALVSGAR